MANTNRRLRVLVADDERLIADSLVMIFRTHGFDATSVYSGYSAIETALTLLPDVIICDISMPGVNGVDAVLSMSRRLPETKFLLFSGHAQSQNSLSRAREQGLKFVYLNKPVRPQIFIEYLTGYAAVLNASVVPELEEATKEV